MFSFAKTFKLSILVAAFVLIPGVAVGQGVGEGQEDRIRFPGDPKSGYDAFPLVVSTSRSLQVVAVERAKQFNRAITITLRNISQKNIKAYAIASGKRWVIRNHFFTDVSIASNAEDRDIIPFRPAYDNRYTITAVMFEDGTTEGEPIFTSRLTDTYEGMRAQAVSLLPCLEKLNPSDESLVMTCEREAKQLPAKGKSSDYEKGLEKARAELVSQLQKLRKHIHNGDLNHATIERDKLLKTARSFAQQS